GLMIGRAIDYSEQEQKKLDETIIQVVKNEFSQNELPIISHMDFGHTNPQFILPLGIDAEINPIEKTFKLLESPFK
ncbi:MAG: LD-carboxypeptidase, partial [Candidatus Falkowbacteria bacterium]|nr:LD-carboxypeptidase [Candidatus Falkowbacteria bacterium]